MYIYNCENPLSHLIFWPSFIYSYYHISDQPTDFFWTIDQPIGWDWYFITRMSHPKSLSEEWEDLNIVKLLCDIGVCVSSRPRWVDIGSIYT